MNTSSFACLRSCSWILAVGLADYSVVKGKTLAKVMYVDITPHHICPSLTTTDVHRMPFIASPIMHGCSISRDLWASLVCLLMSP